MKRRIAALVLVLVVMPFAMFAAGGKTYKIGVAMKDLSDQFVKNIADAVKERAAQLPEVQLIMTDAQGDMNKQLAQVENFVAQKVDAVILNAQDASGLGSAVDLCKKAHIPIIECNTLTSNTNYDVYVGSDDIDAGKIQGEYVKKILGTQGDIAILHGPIGQSGEIKRKQGLKAALLDTTPGVKVLAEQTANWKRDQAMSITEDWLQRFPSIKAICAQNDDMAMGALAAVEAAGKLNSVIIVGVDAIPDALAAVRDGKMACTVFQDSKGQAAGSVDVALKLAKGGNSPKEVMIPFQLVTKDNVDKFIGKNAK
jgi:inositol transport system substrate-binding protein